MFTRSFVKRDRKLSPSQQEVYTNLMKIYSLNLIGEQLDLVKVFGREAPLFLEIGFGTGQALLDMARQQPMINFIGVEVYRWGILAVLKKIAEHNLTNVRIFDVDVIKVLQQAIPDASLTKVLIFFPDPWPKRRHHKRRLIQPEFIQLISAKLKTGGQLHMATDWRDYADHMLKVLNNAVGLKNLASDRLWVARPDYRPLTKFEQRGKNLGHQIYDLLFEKF